MMIGVWEDSRDMPPAAWIGFGIIQVGLIMHAIDLWRRAGISPDRHMTREDVTINNS